MVFGSGSLFSKECFPLTRHANSSMFTFPSSTVRAGNQGSIFDSWFAALRSMLPSLSMEFLLTFQLTCLLQTVPAAGCSLIDTACQCGNNELAQATFQCLLQNCTMQDSLGRNFLFFFFLKVLANMMKSFRRSKQVFATSPTKTAQRWWLSWLSLSMGSQRCWFYSAFSINLFLVMNGDWMTLSLGYLWYVSEMWD